MVLVARVILYLGVLAILLTAAMANAHANYGGTTNCYQWYPGSWSCNTKDVIIETDRNYDRFEISQVFVDGYVRGNGTYVAPHVRSLPNDNPYDNYGRGR